MRLVVQAAADGFDNQGSQHDIAGFNYHEVMRKRPRSNHRFAEQHGDPILDPIFP